MLNCAVVQDAFPAGARLVDVGSGAGLPGVALAIVRPDLEVHLVEPMLRRTEWLSGVVDELALDNVSVHRGRAEDLAGAVAAPFVTARAVARLDKLARWCVPLLEPGGTLVAMKGRSAAEELSADRRALERLGLVAAAVTEHGGDLLDEPVLTVDLRFEPKPSRRAGKPGKGARAGRPADGPERQGRPAGQGDQRDNGGQGRQGGQLRQLGQSDNSTTAGKGRLDGELHHQVRAGQAARTSTRAQADTARSSGARGRPTRHPGGRRPTGRTGPPTRAGPAGWAGPAHWAEPPHRTWAAKDLERFSRAADGCDLLCLVGAHPA